jgi:hypothetical protein
MKKFFSRGNRCLEQQKEVRKLPKSLTNTPGVYMQHVMGVEFSCSDWLLMCLVVPCCAS